MNHPMLFQLGEMMQLQAAQQQKLREAAGAPFKLVAAFFQSVVVVFVGYVEWELVYRVFAYLEGDGDYWSPTLMGFTSAIMVVGFHLLAMVRPDNLAMRFVDRVVQVLIPLYVLGVGLLIAAIIYADGLSGLLDPAPPVNILGTPPEDSSGVAAWLDGLFTHLTNPAAVLIFSLGVGGLAICNLFVAHHLMVLIAQALGDAVSRAQGALQARADWTMIRKAQKAYADKALALENHDRTWTDETVRRSIIAAVLSTINDALMQHKQWLQNCRLHTGSRFDQDDGIHADAVERGIADIESITWADVDAALNPQHPEVSP